MIGDHIGSDARADNILLASKLNDPELAAEQLCFTLTQKEIKIMTIDSTVVALAKRVKFLASGSRRFLQKNDETF